MLGLQLFLLSSKQAVYVPFMKLASIKKALLYWLSRFAILPNNRNAPSIRLSQLMA